MKTELSASSNLQRKKGKTERAQLWLNFAQFKAGGSFWGPQVAPVVDKKQKVKGGRAGHKEE